MFFMRSSAAAPRNNTQYSAKRATYRPSFEVLESRLMLDVGAWQAWGPVPQTGWVQNDGKANGTAEVVSGRVTSIVIANAAPAGQAFKPAILLGTASGGIWKTDNVDDTKANAPEWRQVSERTKGSGSFSAQ